MVDWSNETIPLGVHSFKAFSVLKRLVFNPIDLTAEGEVCINVPFKYIRDDIWRGLNTEAARAKLVHQMIGSDMKKKIFMKGHYPSKKMILYDSMPDFTDDSKYVIELEESSEYDSFLILCAMMDTIGMKTNHPRLNNEQIEDQRKLIERDQFDPIKIEMLKNLEQEIKSTTKEMNAELKLCGDLRDKDYTHQWIEKQDDGRPLLYPEWAEQWEKKRDDIKKKYEDKLNDLKEHMIMMKFEGHIAKAIKGNEND